MKACLFTQDVNFELEREEIRERENGEVGAGRFIRGRRLIEGRLLFEEIRYSVYYPTALRSVQITLKTGTNIKQLLDEVEHDIMNYQNRGLCYLPKQKAEADNTDTRF